MNRNQARQSYLLDLFDVIELYIAHANLPPEHAGTLESLEGFAEYMQVGVGDNAQWALLMDETQRLLDIDVQFHLLDWPTVTQFQEKWQTDAMRKLITEDKTE